jgi:hypothetical protein
MLLTNPKNSRDKYEKKMDICVYILYMYTDTLNKDKWKGHELERINLNTDVNIFVHLSTFLKKFS